MGSSIIAAGFPDRNCPDRTGRGLAAAIGSLASIALVGSVVLAVPANDPPTPQQLLTRALSQVPSIDEPFDRQFLLATIATSQCAIGDERGALASMELLPNGKNSWRPLVCTEIAVFQASQGRFEAAMNTLESIYSIAFHDLAARRIAVVQEKAGDRRGAARSVQSITQPDRKVATLLDLAAARTSAGDRDAASDALAQASKITLTLPEPYRRAQSWVDVGKAHANLGDPRAAREIFQRARRTADELRDETEHAYACYVIVRGQAEAGDFKGAWETTGSIRDETDVAGTRIKDKSLRAIVQSLARAGKLYGADQTSSQIIGSSERAHSLALVAEAEAQKGEIDKARRRLRQAFKLIGSGSGDHLLALAAIAKCMVALKDFEGARTVAGTIDTGIRDEVLGQIAAAEIRAGDLQAALLTYRLIKNHEGGRHKDVAARIIATERMRRRDPETLAWAEQLTTPSERIHALLGIVDGSKSSNK